METLCVCKKCMGLLPSNNNQLVKDHMSKCKGNIQESECERFCVEKSMLLRLLGDDNPNLLPTEAVAKSKSSMSSKLSKVDKSVHCEERKERENEAINKKVTKITIKTESSTSEPEVKDDTLRRSKRNPKPIKREPTEIWESFAKSPNVMPHPEKANIPVVIDENDERVITIENPVIEELKDEDTKQTLLSNSKEDTNHDHVEAIRMDTSEMNDGENHHTLDSLETCEANQSSVTTQDTTVTVVSIEVNVEQETTDDVSPHMDRSDHQIMEDMDRSDHQIMEDEINDDEIEKQMLALVDNNRLEKPASIKKKVAKKEPKMTGVEYRAWKERLEVEYKPYREFVKDAKGNDNIQYRCPKCQEKTFLINRIGMFSRHYNTCRPPGDPGLKCSVEGCDFVAKDSKRMSEHKRYHLMPYMCEFCSRRFADKRNMKEHRMTHTGELPHKCPQCDYRCRNKRLMKEHIRKHTGQMEACPEPGCSFMTPYHGSLMSHIQFKHREKTRYKCISAGCTYITNNKGAMQKHTALHTGDKQYKCSMCDYRATSKFTVVTHMRCHTREKLYFCDRCNYSASYTSAFKQHMMMHLGMKTWQCGWCGYNSNTRAKVLRHVAARHPDSPPQQALINLGLRLTLDLKKYRREPAEGAMPAPQYVVVEQEPQEQVMEEVTQGHMVEVNSDEIFLPDNSTQEGESGKQHGDHREEAGQGEVVVMTSDGHQLIIPHSSDMDMMTILQEVAIKQEQAAQMAAQQQHKQQVGNNPPQTKYIEGVTDGVTSQHVIEESINPQESQEVVYQIQENPSYTEPVEFMYADVGEETVIGENSELQIVYTDENGRTLQVVTDGNKSEDIGRTVQIVGDKADDVQTVVQAGNRQVVEMEGVTYIVDNSQPAENMNEQHTVPVT